MTRARRRLPRASASPSLLLSALALLLGLVLDVRHAWALRSSAATGAEAEALSVQEAPIWLTQIPSVPWMSDFHVGLKITTGQYGTVYMCKAGRREGSEEFALKVQDIEEFEDKEMFEREHYFLETLSNAGPYFIGYRGSMAADTSAGPRGLILMERADATLADLIRQRRSLPNKKKKWRQGVDPCMVKVGADILQGLKIMAEGYMVHGDVAPSNIFLVGRQWRSGECRAKLGDFGSAGYTLHMMLKYHVDDIHHRHSGTPRYSAPEALFHTVRTSSGWSKTDVWSAGVTLTEMFTGRLPRTWSSNATEKNWHIHRCENHDLLEDHIRSKVEHPELKRLLERMTSLNPILRPSIREASKRLEHIAHDLEIELPPKPPKYSGFATVQAFRRIFGMTAAPKALSEERGPSGERLLN